MYLQAKLKIDVISNNIYLMELRHKNGLSKKKKMDM